MDYFDHCRSPREGATKPLTQPNDRQNNDGPAASGQHPKTKHRRLACTSPYAVGEFIGQGRTLSYYGLVSAVLRETQEGNVFGNWDESGLNRISNRVLERLQHQRKRPRSWFATSLVCLLMSAKWSPQQPLLQFRHGRCHGLGRLFDFQFFEFYRDYYNLTRGWIACARLASSVSIM